MKKNLYKKHKRIWGRFYILHSELPIKLKLLEIDPGKGLSYQRHQKRDEIWHITEGSCVVKLSENDPENFKTINLSKEETIHIKKNAWHQIINENNEICKIIEVQYGDANEEEDIERLYFYDKNTE